MQALLIIAILLSAVETSKILLIPFPMHSHISELALIGEELLKKGHEVSIILPPTLPNFEKYKSKTNFNVLSHHIIEEDWQTLYKEDSDQAENFIETILELTFLQDLRASVDPYVPGFTAVCRNPLSDENLFKQAKDMQFDLGIIDGFVNTRCMYTLLYRLGIPYVTLTTQYEPWLWRAPALPSFVPFPLGTVHTQEMTFWQRLTNLYHVVDWFSNPRVMYLEDTFVSDYAPEKPFVTLNYLAGRSQMWLLDTDVTLDYPRPSMPNVVEVGGLTTGPAKPLPPDLEKFVSEASEGVIIVSFGSFGGNLPRKMKAKLFESFKQVKQRVIWRFLGEPPTDLAPHIKLLEWIPQVDLLAHPNVKLFVTHSGANGQFESFYHAVPMIGFPLFGDQMYNSVRMESKGFGLAMDLLRFKPNDLVENINAIIGDPSYYENIKRASDIFKDRPLTPVQRSVYWIEHVLKYGGDYMHSHGLDIPWYQYCMLDILLFLLGVCLGTVFVVCKIVRLLFCRQSVKEKLS